MVPEYQTNRARGRSRNQRRSRALTHPHSRSHDAMAARAYWQGQIRLALVSIPVEVYAATKSGATIAFHQIHEPSGKRINYEKVVQGIGPVDRDEIVKGYEVSKGHYVLLDDDEIEAAKVESRKTLDLVQFVDAGEIDVFYFEKPYYVVPADDLAEEAFVVLRDALRNSGKVGIGQISVRGRETLVSLKPCGKGIVLETLRYEDEVRKAQSYFKDIPATKPDKALLDLATTLIEQRTGKFDPGEFHDRYVDALKKLIEKKRKAKGKKILEDVEEPEPLRGDNVIDLMAALKRSVGSKEEGGKKKAATKKPAARKAPAKKPAAKARKRA
jgi:DNA end-binding protein Ku